MRFRKWKTGGRRRRKKPPRAGPRGMLGRSGRVAKLADARDLKSRIPRGVCGFDPRLGHMALPAAATGSILPHTGPGGYFGRMPVSTESVSSSTRRRSGPPVWLPWVLAPGFLLLPIGGCGVAATLRRPATAACAASAPASVPLADSRTRLPEHDARTADRDEPRLFLRPATWTKAAAGVVHGQSGPVATVATVMPPHRSVAWHPGAN